MENGEAKHHARNHGIYEKFSKNNFGDTSISNHARPQRQPTRHGADVPRDDRDCHLTGHGEASFS